MFIQFDIENFYSSISKYLLIRAINQTKSFVTISKEEVVKTIMQSCKSLLFNNMSVWIKRERDPGFNFNMGWVDGVEIYKVVGAYISNVLGQKYGKERVGLYRNDGLACFENVNGPPAEKIRKNVMIFKEEFNFCITSETKLKIVNF